MNYRVFADMDFSTSIYASSTELRDAGNKLYQAKKFSQAIAKYTRSAQFAPPTSEALSLAFANRSAVLFQVSINFVQGDPSG